MAAPPTPPSDRLFAAKHDDSQRLTWGDMVQYRNRIAHSLSTRLPARDVIAGAIYGKNCPEWLLCHTVCSALGLRFSPINWHLVPDEIAYIVGDCDADIVFFGVEFSAQVLEIKSRTQTHVWICMNGSLDGTISLSSLLAETSKSAVPPLHQRLGGMISYTGGTSGRPKGAVRINQSMSPEVARAMFEQWGFMRLMPEPVMLVCAPLYHAMPLAWFSFGLVLGATNVIMSKFDSVGALAAIQQFRVNGFYAPPILLKRLMQAPADAKSLYDLSSIRTIMSGGAACPVVVKRGIVDMFGPVLHEVYGATELGGVALMGPDNMLNKPLSCGRPGPGMDVIILSDAKKKIETPRVVGEIFAKGFVVDGYHKLETKTKEAMFGDYFSVGDVGYFDEDGFLYISDRKIDMIISGGANIYPVQVEEIFQAHPDIEDVAVFGVPDDEFGERVHAAVKLRSGRHSTAEDILQFCTGKIGKFQLPKAGEISFHAEDFPRSEAGKLRKKELKAIVLSHPRSKL